MRRRPKFTLVFAPETVEQMKAIDRNYHNMIRQTINEQLEHGANKPTRNRKCLQTPAPFGATWELRLGPSNRFRVFYEVDENQKWVNILAIGIKDRDRLLIGGQEFK